MAVLLSTCFLDSRVTTTSPLSKLWWSTCNQPGTMKGARRKTLALSLSVPLLIISTHFYSILPYLANMHYLPLNHSLWGGSCRPHPQHSYPLFGFKQYNFLSASLPFLSLNTPTESWSNTDLWMLALPELPWGTKDIMHHRLSEARPFTGARPAGAHQSFG